MDLAELTLLDSTGVAALVDCHRAASAIGQTFAVINARDAVRRALDVTGVLGVLSQEHRPDDPPETEVQRSRAGQLAVASSRAAGAVVVRASNTPAT